MGIYLLSSNFQIYIAALSTALLMIILISIIIIAVLKYQNRSRLHLLELNTLKDSFQRELLKTQIEIQEETLRFLSMEIHDNIGQILSLVKMNLHSEASTIQENVKLDPTIELVGKAIIDLRNLSKTLNGNYISQHSLPEAVEIELKRIKSLGKYRTQLNVNGNIRPVDPQKHLIIFRIIQEALNNILKHSGGNRIEVSLCYNKMGLECTISDNGIGFNPGKVNYKNDKGTGLSNINYRTKLLGGSYSLDSKIGKGTTLYIKLPD